jgi:inner membrane protein
MTQKNLSFTEKNAAIIKVAAITLLILLLLIPIAMIQSLISERNNRLVEATGEISSKWGYQQEITGPVLVVPYLKFNLDKNRERVDLTRHYAYFLPDELKVSGTIKPEIRYRGIFQVAVYNAALKLNGHFTKPVFDLDEPNIEIDWKGAFLNIGISDLRGINQAIVFKWNDLDMPCEPGIFMGNNATSGITVNKPFQAQPDNDAYNFSIDISVNGSSNLSIVPVGKETTTELVSSWKNPGFDGAFLPATRQISDSGFNAQWKVLELNRNFPQKWYDRQINLSESAFGVNLVLPVEGYQITERSMKYAILFFSLTFMIFFFVEILRKLRVHPIQYILVGFGLSLFYLLLLSLSEHLGFGPAYLIASLGIVLMITGYSLSIFRDNKLSMMLGGFLVILYGFLYVLLQMQDYALLMGSLGLFVILALIMFLSRKIDWYTIGNKGTE